MMRNLFAMFSLLFSVLYFAQAGANPFAGENTNNNSSNRYSSPQELGKNNGNGNGTPGIPNIHASETGKANAAGSPTDPPNPLPIDDYIPVFILVAVGLIVYQTRSAKNVKA